MKNLKLKRNLLIVGSYIITSIGQIASILYTHRFDFSTFISLIILNVAIVEHIKSDFEESING
jgi:hypothetical protein